MGKHEELAAKHAIWKQYQGAPLVRTTFYGFRGHYKGVLFRSYLELSFMVETLEEQHKIWLHGEDTDYAIPWRKPDGHWANYHPDFILPDEQLFIEIKPASAHKDIEVVLKKKAAEEYCKKIDFKYRIVDPMRMETEKAIRLYVEGLIRFAPESEDEFIRRHREEISNYKRLNKCKK